jgi:RHS repeat-associated protein
VTELRYYPWGGARYNPGGQLTTYRFTGQRWDSGTAMYFYGSRWYDPVIGRFLSADTIVPEPGNPQSLNRYSYVGNRPTVFVDPTGHAKVCGTDVEGGCGGPTLPPPQPPGTPWDTPLDFWIEPGGAYGQGVVFLQVQGVTYGPISVFVPAPKYASSAGWSAVRRYRGGLTMIKRGTGLQNMIAGYAAAHQASGSTDDPLRLVPYKIGVKQQDVFLVDGRGQPQKGYGVVEVPGQYDTGGLGAGTTAEAAANVFAAINPGYNPALRYVSITIEQRVVALRALVVAEYPVQAWVSWSDTATPWYLETPIPPSPYRIGQDWSQTTLGSR